MSTSTSPMSNESGRSKGPPDRKEDARDEDAKYKTFGLPSVPKNPINHKTVPFDKVLERLKSGYYGEGVRYLCYGEEGASEEEDTEFIKRALFLGGRDFGCDIKYWNDKMEDLVGLDEEYGPECEAYHRFEDLLRGCGDQDLINEQIGAEQNDTYDQHGEAIGKTYKQLYGDQVVCIMRYLQQNGAFGFLSDKDMEKLVYFFRFESHGTCHFANLCVIMSYHGQKAFGFDSVVYPLDLGQLIRAFTDEDLYEYVMNDNVGDSFDKFKEILLQLGFKRNAFGTDSERLFFRPLKGVDTHIMIPRFDMKAGQAFKDVEAEWVELNAQSGSGSNTHEEVQLQIQLAEEKTRKKFFISDFSWGDETTLCKKVRRCGDGSVPMHWHQSPERIKPAPCHHTVAISHENNHGLIDSAQDEENSLSQVHDWRPAVQTEEIQEQDPTHTMICIGGRVDKNNKTFLLLQNSWAKMPLVEVSLDYFLAAESLEHPAETRDTASSSYAMQNQHHTDYKVVKLPRVEVQLLCTHDIRPDFDVRETFSHFYQEFFFPALSHNDDDDTSDDMNALNHVMENAVDASATHSIQQQPPHVGSHGDDTTTTVLDTELYTFVSLSDVSDVKHSEEYYDTCDQQSTTVLATMDVRGYIHVKMSSSQSSSQNHDRSLASASLHGVSSYVSSARNSVHANTHDQHHEDEAVAIARTEQNLETLISKVKPSVLKEYFAQHVCSNPSEETWVNDNSNDFGNGISSDSNDDSFYDAMEYFKAKVRPWNVKMAPAPPSASTDYPYPSTKDRRHFEHNLRLLCKGGVDAVYPNYHKEAYQGPESISSLVLGLVVGVVMFVMIYTEMQQKQHSWDRRRRERRRQQATS
ncbi:MAG: hypothetical protein SGILL_007099, partial [Bacillariaceae sp.]